MSDFTAVPEGLMNHFLNVDERRSAALEEQGHLEQSAADIQTVVAERQERRSGAGSDSNEWQAAPPEVMMAVESIEAAVAGVGSQVSTMAMS